MPKWEVCRIKTVSRKLKFSDYEGMLKDVAVVDTASGEQLVDETIETKFPKDSEKRNQERAKLLGRLLAQGWEPIGSEQGWVTVLRRQVP